VEGVEVEVDAVDHADAAEVGVGADGHGVVFFLEFEGDSPGLSLTKRPKVITA
jgi:hypothetical protein